MNVNVLASFLSSCTVYLLFLLYCSGLNFQCPSCGSSESGHPYSVPDLKEKLSKFHPTGWRLVYFLIVYPLCRVRKFPFIPSLIRVFIKNGSRCEWILI